jgi:hypothetical protein
MTIQMMMMRNLTLDPQLLEVVTPFLAIRAVRPFASSASSQSNDVVTSSGKVTHVSRKPSLRRTRRPAKSISLIELPAISSTWRPSKIN